MTVRVALIGPNLYVINKTIGDCALLFDTKMIDGEIVPPMPLMDPVDETFSVHDTLTDCAVDWLIKVWNAGNYSAIRIPVAIISHDGHGLCPPVKLVV